MSSAAVPALNSREGDGCLMGTERGSQEIVMSFQPGCSGFLDLLAWKSLSGNLLLSSDSDLSVVRPRGDATADGRLCAEFVDYLLLHVGFKTGA